jgi:diacylglycerol kinase (ATP)
VAVAAVSGTLVTGHGYTRPMHVIVNPAAAGGRLGRDWPTLHQRMRALGLDPTVLMTKAPGHASELAAQAIAEGSEVVIAAGGDGTICEVVQGLHAAGRGALGILPLGTGNDAARTLGISTRFDEAVAIIKTGTRRRVDLIRAEIGRAHV